MGPCENSNELPGCIRGADFLAQLRDYHLFTKSSAALRWFLSFFLLAHQPPSGTGPPHSRGLYMTHNDTPQSVGPLWTRDQLVADTST